MLGANAFVWRTPASWKEKRFVEYVVAKVSKQTSFHWVGDCTPFIGGGRENVETAWVWEVKCHHFGFAIGSRVEGFFWVGHDIFCW